MHGVIIYAMRHASLIKAGIQNLKMSFAAVHFSWKLEVGSLLINTRPIGPSVTKHIRHITNKVTAD